MTEPDRQSMLDKMREYDASPEAFFKNYGRSRPTSQYIYHNNNYYPLKAIWAASHTPTLVKFKTNQAYGKVRRLDFERRVVQNSRAKRSSERPNSRAEQRQEAKESIRELKFLKRNSKLVSDTKYTQGYNCRVCGFLFSDFYGKLGVEYIEAHHIKPLSTAKGAKLNSVKDLIVLCANCHRMVHRLIRKGTQPTHAIAGLKAVIEEVKAARSRKRRAISQED